MSAGLLTAAVLVSFFGIICIGVCLWLWIHGGLGTGTFRRWEAFTFFVLGTYLAIVFITFWAVLFEAVPAISRLW